MPCTCGHVSLNETDADEEAIADLTRQAQSQRGAMAALTRARRDQLKAEVSAEKAFARALVKTRGELLTALSLAVEISSPLTLLNLTDGELLNLVLTDVLTLPVADFIEQQDKIREAASRALEAIQPGLGFDRISDQIDMIQREAATAVFEEVILPDLQSGIREALRDMAIGVPDEIALSTLNDRLTRSEGRQLTEVKTRISQYGRSITAAAAAAAELDHYLYTGPIDGITRPFCRALAGKVVNSKQMLRLNNGQGLSVITSGGGYNCRHSWSPVTEGFIEAANLTTAKRADINKANDND